MNAVGYKTIIVQIRPVSHLWFFFIRSRKRFALTPVPFEPTNDWMRVGGAGFTIFSHWAANVRHFQPVMIKNREQANQEHTNNAVWHAAAGL